jgi:signal transduction histidine kinase
MEELLEYGKPFKGELYLVSLVEVIAKSVRACLPVAEVARVRVTADIGDDLPLVMVDRRRLSKVFVNLIENAIQHSPVGGTVRIEAQKVFDGNQHWLDCSVKDSGAGILEQDLPNVFEPFFSKRRGGTGLGLAIAHRIMGEHGGTVIAGNNPEGGACMIARFPVPVKEEVIDGQEPNTDRR